MVEGPAIETAHFATRIIESTGIGVGAFGTLILFLYRFISGVNVTP